MKHFPKDDTTLEKKLMELAKDHPREGFWKSYYRIRNGGEKVNHKRLHRVYKRIGLSLLRKTKKRQPARVNETLEVPASFNHTRSIDFVTDALTNCRMFLCFNAIDDFN